MSKTTIQIDDETRDKLRDLGKKGETYDEIIVKLMKFYDLAKKGPSKS